MSKSDSKAVGFLVHPREIQDFYGRFPYLRFFPRFAVEAYAYRGSTVTASKITGLLNREGQLLDGYVFGITMTAKQMLEHRARAVEKIREAIHFAREKNVGIIGLGALTASVTRGGLDLDDIDGIGLTTGRAYTVKTVTDYVSWATDELGNKNERTIGIVGAAGSIGSSCARLLTKRGYKNFILIDLERKLEKLKMELEHLTGHDGVRAKIDHRVSSIRDADIIIAATNAPEVIIEPEDLRPGSIVINDAQPSDISPRVLSERNDVLVVEGGVVHSDTIRANYNFGLANRSDTFSCMGEALILGYHGIFENFAVGELDLSLVDRIIELEKPLDMSRAAPQNSNGTLTREQIERVVSYSRQ